MLVTTGASEAFETLATADVGAIPSNPRMTFIGCAGLRSRTQFMHSAIVCRVPADFAGLPSMADAAIRVAVFNNLTKHRNAEVLLSVRGGAFDNFESKPAALRHAEVP